MMLRRIHFIGLWAALMFSLGLVAPAAAQRGGDDGEYQILSARYGTSMFNVDVTPRLKELARQDRRFRMGNDSFGVDPHPNHVKTLRIYARSRDGSTRTFEYAEGAWVDGAQFSGWGGGNWGHGGWTGGWGDPGGSGGGYGSNRDDDGEYQILHARYGTRDRNEDVTQRLKELARQDRRFRMGNNSFGIDPVPNQVKTLRIFAKGRDGQTRTFEYAENSWVDGSQFTGWGGGNWGHGEWTGGWGDGNSQHHSGGWGSGGRDDDGEYQILQARYGIYNRNVDVTQRLKELARQDRRFRMGNSSFGVDPAPNQVKTLRIFARGKDGHNRTFEYTEGSVVDGSMFSGWGNGNWGQGGWTGGWGSSSHAGSNNQGYRPGSGRGDLNITYASYGADGRQRDITYRVRSRVVNDRLNVRVDNDLAGGDPAPNREKWLWVTYTVGGGAEQRVRINENQRLSLP